MQDVLGYLVYNSKTRKWLSGDGRDWSPDFLASIEFDNLEAANAAMEYAGGDYVFACMPSP